MDTKDFKIAVAGTGYVGLSIATLLSQHHQAVSYTHLDVYKRQVLFIVFKLIGFYVKVEDHTSEGRIDLVLQTDKFIYVMEFKLDGRCV